MVSSPDSEGEIAANREVVLVVRLVLDRHARLQRGELLDAESRSQGRFVTLTELGEVVRRWLSRVRADTERTR